MRGRGWFLPAAEWHTCCQPADLDSVFKRPALTTSPGQIVPSDSSVTQCSSFTTPRPPAKCFGVRKSYVSLVIGSLKNSCYSAPLLSASGVQKNFVEPGRNKRPQGCQSEVSCDAAACFTLDHMKEFHMKRWTMFSPSVRLCSVCLYMKKLKDTGGFWEGASRCVRMRLAAEDEVIQEGRPGGFFVCRLGSNLVFF